MARILGSLLLVASVASGCAGGSTSDATPSTTPSSSSEVIATEAPPIIDETPNAPTGLVVLNTADGEIQLAWDESRSGTVTGYEVTRLGDGLTERFAVSEAEFFDSGLADGAIFTYAVAAISDAGKSERSEVVSARVGVDENPPSAPGRPKVVESVDAAVALEWRESRDISGIDRYVVTRTIDDETVEIEASGQKFVDDEVEPGIIATYSVVAFDSNGNVSEPSRSVTLLTGSTSDDIVIVVSAVGDPAADPQTARLRRELLDAGFVVSWFEDGLFDSNVTDSGDVVLLLGDVDGEGFDFNIFATDATVIGLKAAFVLGGGITENPPKLDRLAQITYLPPEGEPRDVPFTATGRPKPAVYIPPSEQLPDLQIWARPTWSDDIAVAGLIPAGGELANERPAPGCRAFFPGNAGSLAEQTNEGWALLIEFVGDISATC